METFTITKIIKARRKEVNDLVAKEVPLTLIVNDKELVTLLCSPSDIKDLVRGFLFTAGLIKKVDEIKRIVLDEQQWIAHADLAHAIREDLTFKRLYTSGCGRGTFFYNPLDAIHRSKNSSNFTIGINRVIILLEEFRKKSRVYLKTGGVHSAALVNGEGVIFFKEDIGRHNAIDKAVGALLSENGSFDKKILITSGRVSSEVLFKVQKCGIPVVISRSAPTDQAVRLAQDMNVTLVGFARGNRMNIYSCCNRIETQV